MVCHGKIHRHLKSPLEAGVYFPPRSSALLVAAFSLFGAGRKLRLTCSCQTDVNLYVVEEKCPDECMGTRMHTNNAAADYKFTAQRCRGKTHTQNETGVNLRASHYRKTSVTHSIGVCLLPQRESFVLTERQRGYRVSPFRVPRIILALRTMTSS